MFQTNAKQLLSTNSTEKGQNIPNSIFSSQTTLNKAEGLQFGIKNANLATLVQH